MRSGLIYKIMNLSPTAMSVLGETRRVTIKRRKRKETEMTEFQQVQEEPRKLYVFTRADLSPGMQLAQAVHAGTQFVLEHPEYARQWEETWKNLICLQVPNEEDLLGVLDLLTGWCSQEYSLSGAPFSYFIEPDLDDEHTSVACLLTESQGKKFKNLRLSLRPSSPKGGE